jgi:hypothetical protein
VKYLIFLTGLVLFASAISVAVTAAKDGWDATVAAGPGIVGTGLMAAATGIHIYDNIMSKYPKPEYHR